MIPKHNTESVLGPNLDEMIKMTNDEDGPARQQANTEFKKIKTQPEKKILTETDEAYDNFSFQPQKNM